MIEAFIFDLDGIITDTAEFHYLAWKKCAKEIGIDIDFEFNENLKGVSRLESFERILKHRNRENDFSESEKEVLANQKNDHYVSLINTITPKDILPNIENTLQSLREKGIKIGLASASKNASLVINNLGIKEYFDFMADARLCKFSKPHPEIFIRACEGLNVDPRNCVGVEDAYSGITAINECGMFSVGVGRKDVLSNCDLLFSSTSEINLEKIFDEFSKA